MTDLWRQLLFSLKLGSAKLRYLTIGTKFDTCKFIDRQDKQQSMRKLTS